MCSVKTPKPQPQPTSQQKAPVYMRNAYLDGLGISGEAAGRNSLRIDLGGTAPTAPVPRPPSNPGLSFAPPPFGNPSLGMGRGGGQGRGGLGLGIHAR